MVSPTCFCEVLVKYGSIAEELHVVVWYWPVLAMYKGCQSVKLWAAKKLLHSHMSVRYILLSTFIIEQKLVRCEYMLT